MISDHINEQSQTLDPAVQSILNENRGEEHSMESAASENELVVTSDSETASSKSDSPETLKSRVQLFLKTLGIIFVMCLFVFGLSLLSRKKYVEGLRNSINRYLDNLTEITAVAGDSLSAGGSKYSVMAFQKKENGRILKGEFFVLSKITTFYGPVAALFSYSENDDNCRYIGIMNADGKAFDAIQNSIENTAIPFWEKKTGDEVSAVLKIQSQKYARGTRQ